MLEFKYDLEAHMVECSRESFIHTSVQKLIHLHLFTKLFHEDFSFFEICSSADD